MYCCNDPVISPTNFDTLINTLEWRLEHGKLHTKRT